MDGTSADTLFATVLAAGRSQRLRSPKQLARINGERLLTSAVRRARQVAGQRSSVVLGYEWERVFTACRDDIDLFVVNSAWARGMSTSLRLAIATLPGSAEGLLVSVCDQPLVTAEDLERLCSRWRSARDSIVAARYRGRCGVPAILPRRLFAAINELGGDTGARDLLQRHRRDLIAVDCPHAEFDIDTPEDLERVRAQP